MSIPKRPQLLKVLQLTVAFSLILWLQACAVVAVADAAVTVVATGVKVTAKAVGAEAVEDELIRISDGRLEDGGASPDDVSRSQLRINTRKWLLQVWNRKRYGDVKTVESHSTTRFDVSSASSAELQRRVLESLGLDESIAGEEFAGEEAGGEADDILSGLFGGGGHER